MDCNSSHSNPLNQLSRPKLAALALGCVATTLVATACDLGLGGFVDPVNRAVNQIDVAVNTLQTDSSRWELIVRDLINDLPDAENDIKADIDEVLQRGIGAATVSVIATADFMSRRMTEGLLRARAKLTGQTYIEQPPAFIMFTPDKIERARVPSQLNSITLYGYDFDRKDPQGEGLKLKLLEGNQIIDVTHALTLPTHYQGLFNLGANGVQLTANSNQLILVWNNSPISTLAVIQPPPPQPRDIDVGLSNITYIPPKTHGDGDFDGHGPVVTLETIAAVSNNMVWAEVYMKAYEPEGDHTTAEGWSDYKVVYIPPPGVRIQALVSAQHSEASYVDTNHSQDVITMGDFDLVRTYTCVGDTSGDEAGTKTSVNVEFNLAKLRVIDEQ